MPLDGRSCMSCLSSWKNSTCVHVLYNAVRDTCDSHVYSIPILYYVCLLTGIDKSDITTHVYLNCMLKLIHTIFMYQKQSSVHVGVLYERVHMREFD